MYTLVPPTSKEIEYKSVYMTNEDAPLFILKVFGFDEDATYSSIYLSSLETDTDGEIVKDGKGIPIMDNEYFYIEVLKLGLKRINNLKDDKFNPSWKLVKELVNKIIEINSVTDMGK